MASQGTCSGCGRPLSADALRELCPECLIKAGFGTGASPPALEPTADEPFAPPSPIELARLFPQLELIELLGKGGMGAVYKARQPALDRWVALKVLPPQTAAKAGFSERFNREARALARLNHPHIVAVHDFGQAGGLPYFIMEYVDGVTLRQLVEAGKLAPEQALAIVPQICEALQFAHDEGVVHRDIKPENILLDRKGRVKIADFGIAKIVEGEEIGRPPITAEQQVIGTPHYMAPEQVEKPHLVDHRADIYSLGVVFYEMLTGELPLGRFAPPSQKVQVDVRLDEVVLHALEKEPKRRYQQASEVKTDVETIASGPLPTTKPANSSNGHSRIPAVALGAVGVVALLALILALLSLVNIPGCSKRSDRQNGWAPLKTGNTAVSAAAVERVLKAKDECFLNLDTGQTHGPAIVGGETDLPAGMDLSIPFIPVGAEFRADRVVALDHLELQTADSSDWNLSLHDLKERLTGFAPQVIGGSSARELANQQTELPRTFRFRTSQWSEGLLQIVAFTSDPPGVKLRYKFVGHEMPRRQVNRSTFGPARPLAATWPDGIRIELVGLSDYPSEGGKNWRVSGEEFSSPVFDTSDLDIRSYAPPGTRPVELFLSVTGLTTGPGSAAELDLSNAFWTGRKFKQSVWQRDIKAIALQVPTNASVLHATLILNAAEQLRMSWSLRTNVWLTDAASLLPAPLREGERAVAFMYVSLRPGYSTSPQVRLMEPADFHSRTGIIARIYTLKPGEAVRLLEDVQKVLGAGGAAVSDERTHSIIVAASPSLHEGVAQLLSESNALAEPSRRFGQPLETDTNLNQHTNTAVFGPIIDRLLDFDGRKKTAYLDLDTGQHLDLAYEFPYAADGTPPGVDLRSSTYESDTRARLAINMALKAVATNRWDATPAELRKELAMAKRQAEVRLLASDVPQVFFFRTSEGGQGILQFQIGPMPDGNHQFHVRYKLLLSPVR